jgi:hypothetical protein
MPYVIGFADTLFNVIVINTDYQVKIIAINMNFPNSAYTIKMY